MWIFGYGSLIWRTDFPFRQKRLGFIKGYSRRFWQASLDHRGTPEKPGRVVTLVSSDDEQERVWGVAYELEQERAADTLASLDIREQCGYQRHLVTFYPLLHTSTSTPHPSTSTPSLSTSIPSPSDCLQLHELESTACQQLQLTVYVATADNPYYVGPATDDSIADVIASACGPSGANCDYLFRLLDSLRAHFPHVHEPHLAALETAVRARQTVANSQPAGTH